MGLTFLYAGLQHLTDPSYFDPSKSGYIGHLILQYAVGSPIHNFLIGVVGPNAVSFGWMVAIGEVLIGIADFDGIPVQNCRTSRVDSQLHILSVGDLERFSVLLWFGHRFRDVLDDFALNRPTGETKRRRNLSGTLSHSKLAPKQTSQRCPADNRGDVCLAA